MAAPKPTSPHQQLATSYRLTLAEAFAEMEAMERAASAAAERAQGTEDFARRQRQRDALITARQLLGDCLLVGTPGQRGGQQDQQLSLFGAAS